MKNITDDSDSDFDENAFLVENWCEKYQLLLNKYIKITIAYELLKTEHDMLKEEKENYLEKFNFQRMNMVLYLREIMFYFEKLNKKEKLFPLKLRSFTQGLGTKILNKIIKKCKSLGDKRGLGHANKNETPIIGETMFIKGKEETPKSIASSTTPLQCSICKRKNRIHLM